MEYIKNDQNQKFLEQDEKFLSMTARTITK